MRICAGFFTASINGSLSVVFFRVMVWVFFLSIKNASLGWIFNVSFTFFKGMLNFFIDLHDRRHCVYLAKLSLCLHYYNPSCQLRVSCQIILSANYYANHVGFRWQFLSGQPVAIRNHVLYAPAAEQICSRYVFALSHGIIHKILLEESVLWFQRNISIQRSALSA